MDSQVVTDEDGNLFRMQKKVIPAGTENEFYIYLNVEPVYYHDWKTIFLGSGMLLNSANNQDEYNTDYGFGPNSSIEEIKIGLTGSKNGMQGHSSMLVSEENAPLTSTYTDQTGKDVYIKTIELQRFENDTEPIVIDNVGLVFSFSQNSSGSFTIIYSAPNSNSCVKLSNIWWDGNGRGDKNNGGLLRFPEEAYQALINANSSNFDYMNQKTFPISVTDEMGEYIEFLGVESCSTGEDSVEFINNTLT